MPAARRRRRSRNVASALGRCRAASSVFECGQAAPAPIARVDFLNDDVGGIEGLLEDIEQELACALDERRFFLGSDRARARPRTFASD